MPILLLIAVPLVATATLAPWLRHRFRVQRIAAACAFASAVGLMTLFVTSEWRPDYGSAKVGEAALAVLFVGALTAAVDRAVWTAFAAGWRRLRGPGSE